MRKYNKPEMKVSTFCKESILTESTTLELYEIYANTSGVQEKVLNWETDVTITF